MRFTAAQHRALARAQGEAPEGVDVTGPDWEGPRR